MLNFEEINELDIEKFSLQRKVSLQTLAKGQSLKNDDLKWMIKNTFGSLKKGLRKYQKSSKTTEEICSLADHLSLDDSELRDVELALAKTLAKNNN